MSKIKLKKGLGARPSLLIALLLVLAVGVGTFVWNQHRLGAKAEDSTVSSKIGLSGTVSSLDIVEWGIRVSFKDADKVKYSVGEANGDHLVLYARGVLLPVDECSRIGATLNRSTGKTPGYQNTRVGNYYYYFTRSPSYCSPNKQDSPRTANFKKSLVSNLFESGGYTITAQ